MSTNLLKLEIINDMSIQIKWNFQNYFNILSGKLYLSYPTIQENTEECWTNIILQMLDNYKEIDIINNTKELYLETDFYFSFPTIFLRFPNIKVLEIAGCRWFHLDCNQIPISVQHLILTQHSNLPQNIMIGSQSLINLQKLDLDITPFFGNGEMLYIKEIKEIEEIESIPDLGNLIEVSIYFYGCGIDIETIEYVNIYKDIIKNHKLFENIKYRISDIYIDNIERFVVKLL